MIDSVKVCALNGLELEDWGPSDHCRIEIEILF